MEAKENKESHFSKKQNYLIFCIGCALLCLVFFPIFYPIFDYNHMGAFWGGLLSYLIFFGWIPILLPFIIAWVFVGRLRMPTTKSIILISCLLLIIPTFLDSVYIVGINSISVSTLQLSSDRETNVNVRISSDIISNDSIGNEWNIGVNINGRKFVNGDLISLFLGDNLEIQATVTEEDTIPDVGTGIEKLPSARINLEAGTTVVIPVTVKENRGRYSGNIAKWIVSITFIGTPPERLNYWGIIHKVLFGI